MDGAAGTMGHIDGGGSVILNENRDHHEDVPAALSVRDEPYDMHRLERAVRALADGHARLAQENAALRASLEHQDHRVRELEDQLLTANQRRQEAGKRLDELIAQLDHLEAQLAGE